VSTDCLVISLTGVTTLESWKQWKKRSNITSTHLNQIQLALVNYIEQAYQQCTYYKATCPNQQVNTSFTSEIDNV